MMIGDLGNRWVDDLLGGVVGVSLWSFLFLLSCGSPTRPLWRCMRGCTERAALYMGDLAVDSSRVIRLLLTGGVAYLA